MKTVFVTVGTTSFDDLIATVTSHESVKALIDRGYTDMVLQVGRGSVEPDPDGCPGLTLQVFRFKDSIAEDMRHSDLVISHAGAGSCLEALGANKPLLVVVNDKLMDNHQLELAKQLQADSHLIYCTCSTLPQTLRDMDLSTLTTYAPAVDLSVQCQIINAEYVDCFWHPNTSTMNYTFSSIFVDDQQQDCPQYIIKHNYTVGCRTPLKDHKLRFKKFYTNVSTDGKHTISKTFDSLQKKVQLNPPYNLSLMWNEQDNTLSLHWNSSSPLQTSCVVHMVRNQKDTSQSLTVTGTSYNLSQVSQNKPYVFEVRSTVADNCGGSDFWSNWSDPVEWGSTGNISRQVWGQGLYGILLVLLLFPLCLLLCYCERKKIILLPVVPDPSKNLQDLFHKHDGNVESWVHISRELKEAFEPDYTETLCDVCEVTPSCDACPTPVASPTSQTDNCDEPSVEEELADETSAEEEHVDQSSTEEKRADEPSAEEEHIDEPSTEESAEQQSS
ncbi:hypothetical protein QQF64_007427 [Cirrhinus molitorella]|uniref:UDP-N-acetylglucosamine transferase subunit ALG13 n=2 Tax=Cirrhinus molitorella TaxID=172907 RepID=A0AA88PJ36_9TELE|nr:hypothetical protein Q8A67_013853 [Cirrhinus molitorella]